MDGAVLCSSAKFVADNQKLYIKDGTLKDIKPKFVSLMYPNKSTEDFPLIKPLKDGEYNPIDDLIESIKALHYLYHTTAPSTHSDENLKQKEQIFEEINNAISALNIHTIEIYKTSSEGKEEEEYCKDYRILEHIIEQSYSRVLYKPQLLNKYKKFSNEVYGEAKPAFVERMLADLNSQYYSGGGPSCHKLGKGSIFIDLGSGVGTVPLQIAAQTGATCYGIELRALPAAFAKSLQYEFSNRLKAYRYSHGPVQLLLGDFFSDPTILSLLHEADVIFANNLVFGPLINTQLLDMFVCLKEGAKVICLVPFAAPNMTANAGNFHLPASMFETEKFDYEEGCMSWTQSGGHYYIHTVNRLRLKKFEPVISQLTAQ